jgi:hypothetical protein
MKFVRCFVAILLAPVFVGVSPVSAEDVNMHVPWSKSCHHYKTSKQFVRESTLYCLRQPGQKGCKEQAQRYFEACRYSGDFQRMSARMGARMLLVLALGSVGSVNQLDL